MVLNLGEELFLLSINDAKGTLMSGYLNYGLAGALLSDLALRDKLIIDEKKRLILREGLLTGDPLLDELIVQIRDARRPRQVRGWINRLATNKLIGRVAGWLVEQGVLICEKKCILGLFPYTVYRQQDVLGRPSTAKYEVK